MGVTIRDLAALEKCHHCCVDAAPFRNARFAGNDWLYYMGAPWHVCSTLWCPVIICHSARHCCRRCKATWRPTQKVSFPSLMQIPRGSLRKEYRLPVQKRMRLRASTVLHFIRLRDFRLHLHKECSILCSYIYKYIIIYILYIYTLYSLCMHIWYIYIYIYVTVMMYFFPQHLRPSSATFCDFGAGAAWIRTWEASLCWQPPIHTWRLGCSKSVRGESRRLIGMQWYCTVYSNDNNI